MLDGLLGRSGFYTKCKSLIKQTRTRIEVVKRKRNATNKFLRKDIADLLANGLDSNAYSRAEGLMAELILSSCYDFIDHVCEIILKHLSVLQKLRDCPKDCREGVASLMYAAARFSDLPELRELRDLFQERYGSSVEYYVNQKLVENITPKPPTMEKKVQLMREIATEFSIWWDSRGFEERLSNPSAIEKNKQPSPAIHNPVEHKVASPSNEETSHKVVKNKVLVKRSETTSRDKERKDVDRHHTDMGRDDPLETKDDLNRNFSRGSETVTDKCKPPLYKYETNHNRQEHAIPFNKENGTSDAEPLSVKRDDVVDGLRSNFRSAIPPPYVKPKKNKHITDDNEPVRFTEVYHKHKASASKQQDTLTFNLESNGYKLENNKPENVDERVHFTEIYYKDASSCEIAPKRRSHRRKHARSPSSKDEKVVNSKMGTDEERVVRRVSTSRRKHESRKGLQILFDDDHYKDDEEKMIDKMLLHYSKKPSFGDPVKPNSKSKPLHKIANEVEGHNPTPSTSRSFSLPSTEPPKKVFTRAASFQPDNSAKHVHPKLPNYDDLAASLAALRAERD